MRMIIGIACLTVACSDPVSGLPDGAAGTDARSDAETVMDAALHPDAAAETDGGSIEDAGELADAEVAEDAAPSDGGETLDGGNPACSTLSRDTCLATPGCVLDGSEIDDPGYFCRDALSACERVKDPGECDASPGCVSFPGACYCPENVTCACGGGRAPVCRDVCGGLAGAVCPSEAFFCELDTTVGGSLCPGNGDQGGVCVPVPMSCAGSGGGPVCGCENDLNPVTYSNDCERRRARASFGQAGPCP